jgi:hypothetical protein
VPDLSETIDQVANEPAAATVDGQSVENQPIPDLIQLERHKAAKAAVAGTNARGGPVSGWRGLRPARAIPPGGV